MLSSKDLDTEYNDKSILTSPNPNDGRFRITYDFDIISYRIFSMDGQRLMKADIDKGNDIDISHLPDGIYIFEGNTSVGMAQRQLIVKRSL